MADMKVDVRLFHYLISPYPISFIMKTDITANRFFSVSANVVLAALLVLHVTGCSFAPIGRWEADSLSVFFDDDSIEIEDRDNKTKRISLKDAIENGIEDKGKGIEDRDHYYAGIFKDKSGRNWKVANNNGIITELYYWGARDWCNVGNVDKLVCEVSGSKMMVKSLEMMKMCPNFFIRIDILKDGTGVIEGYISADKETITWKTEGSRLYITPKYNAPMIFNYEISGAKLTLKTEAGEFVMTFTKQR